MKVIKECINLLDEDAEVYPFGSRTIDITKGGDKRKQLKAVVY